MGKEPEAKPAKDVRKDAARPRLLKDTCDMCSASNVKCDKKKPLCTRCERLEYPCFYSPARRLPKRRPSQQTRSVGQSEPAARQGSSKESVHEKQFSKSHTASSERDCRNTFPEPDDSTAIIQSQRQEQHAAYSLAMNFDINESPSRDSSKGSVDYMEVLPNFGCSNMMSANEPTPRKPQITPHKEQDHHQIACSSCLKDEPEHPQSPTNSDCATVAIDILQKIAATNSPETPSRTTEPADMITATSIKRVSSILICPCSKKADVGMLAAAVCLAVLDQMKDLLESRSDSGSLSPTLAHCSDKEESFERNTRRLRNMATMEKTNRVFSDADKDTHNHNEHPSYEHRTAQSSESSTREVMMVLVDNLPRISNLIAQFTQRYSQERNPATGEIMKSLITVMNSKLQMITEDVTSWVAQI